MNNGTMPLIGFPTADVIYGAQSNLFNLKAGATVQKNDLLELGPDGKCYPVQTTDYAAVNQVTYGTAQTTAATGQIVAQTQVSASQTNAYSRQAVVQSDDGSIFTFTDGASNNYLTKYSAAGALIAQAVGLSGSGYTNHHLLKLSNGNLTALAFSGTNVYYVVYDQNLNLVSSGGGMGEAAANAYFSAVALSGGGFAVVYQQGASPLLSRLVTYSNAGAVVLAPTTIWTRTGTTGTQFHRMAQLSDGNLVVAVSSINTVSSIGLFHGVVTTSGVSVLPFANLDAASYSILPDLSVLNGYYAITRMNGVDQRAFVFNNAGVQQGATFNGGSAPGNANYKLLNDGSGFWLIWPRSSDLKEVLTKLPVTGTGFATTPINASNVTYGYALDAFYENGRIVIIGSGVQDGTPGTLLLVVSTETSQLVSSTSTKVGSNASTQGQYPRCIPGGDFSFICLYDYNSPAATNLAVGKYANTAIMGVAQATAAAEELVATACIAGTYATNPIEGSYSKTFDHSATNIVGNKGTILNNGVVLKGF